MYSVCAYHHVLRHFVSAVQQNFRDSTHVRQVGAKAQDGAPVRAKAAGAEPWMDCFHPEVGRPEA